MTNTHRIWDENSEKIEFSTKMIVFYSELCYNMFKIMPS